MSNIILGAGIAGLIWSYYHKDYTVITDQIGGQMNSAFDLGPRYLHYKSEAVKKFLESLDMEIKVSTIKVGYLDDTGWVSNPDNTFREKYYMKSRNVDNLSGFDSSVMNTNVKEFEVLNVDFKQLISRLFIQVYERIQQEKITKIDLVERLITTDCGLKWSFDNIISTMPLNIFSKLANLNLQLKAFDMSYYLIPNSVLQDEHLDIQDFNFVYDCRSSTNFHRMTKCKHGIVLDYFGDRTGDEDKIPSNLKVLKNCQIISLDKDFELEDKSIKFLGRYGAWSRHYKTETIIEEAQK